jgi:two-component system, cell cycle response regulator
MRILIADDSFTSRSMLASVLKEIGHDVVETANGAEAWNELQKPEAPALAILDWMMPKMDGLEVVRRVRDLQSRKPPYLIILTSKGDKADIVTGLNTGANDYLAKPFDNGELRARVEVGCRMIELQSELLTTRNALAYEATHDYLTGTLNRRAIEAELSRELSRERRRHEGLTVGICDIDFFKKINDTHGHAVGDEALCGFVRLVQNCLRDYDLLGRFGGEEFLVISSAIKDSDAFNLFERIRVYVAYTPIHTIAGDIRITVSIGVKVARKNETIDQLITAADAALYKAKSEGRDRVCLDGGDSPGQ